MIIPLHPADAHHALRFAYRKSFVVGAMAGAVATAGIAQDSTELEILTQFGAVQQTMTRTVFPEPHDQLSKLRLQTAPLSEWVQEYTGVEGRRARIRGFHTLEVDPLLNLRVEIENDTDATQYFAVQFRFGTDIISGPTFQDAFAHVELIDANLDGLATVTSANTWFEVIDDPGNATINGSRNLGDAYAQFQFTPGKLSLFDRVGAGPNAQDFSGAGFNYLRFQTNGYLSAGDRLVVTGMGAYSTDQAYLPARYEIPAVPEPPVALLAIVGGIVVGAWCRRRPARDACT